jgi:hypothetical protein
LSQYLGATLIGGAMAARRVLLGGSIAAEPHTDPRGAFLYALMRQTHSFSSLLAA